MEQGSSSDHSTGTWRSKMKKGWVSFAASVEEGWADAKAYILGTVRKARARTEKEASEADLRTAKAQVEAADAAENKKKQVQML